MQILVGEDDKDLNRQFGLNNVNPRQSELEAGPRSFPDCEPLYYPSATELIPSSSGYVVAGLSA